MVAGPAGVYSVDFGYYAATNQIYWSRELYEGPGLSGLKHLTVANLGQPGVCGVAADGVSILSMVEDSTVPGDYSLDSGFSATTQGTVLDLCTIDFDLDGKTEVVAATTWGLEIFGWDGQATSSFAFSAVKGSLSKILKQEAPQVAWVRGTGSETSLILARPTGLSPMTFLGTQVVSSITSADIGPNGAPDGDDDLLLSFRNTTQVTLLENQNGAFLAGNSLTLSSGKPAGLNNFAAPILADLDGDGNSDVAWVDRKNQTLEVFFDRNWAGYENLIPEIDYVDFKNDDTIYFLHKAKDGLASNIPHMVTATEVRVTWQGESVESGWFPPLLAQPSPYVVTYAPSPNNGHPSVTFAEFPSSVVNEELRGGVQFVEARFIEVHGTTILKKYPPLFFAMCANSDEDSIQYALSLSGSAQLLDISQFGNGEQTGVGQIPPPPTVPEAPPVLIPRD